jgi:hypothetical protein
MPDEYPFPPCTDFTPPNGDHYRETAAKLRDLVGQCCFVITRGELMKLAASFDRRADRMGGRSRKPREEP